MPEQTTKSEVTTHPSFAVIGVLLGALTSVFTGRLLSIGAADVQGAIGASADYMTWLSTAYNAANMFIGPLTVFLGAIFGARRVLLWASLIFIISEFLSPLVAHDQLALLVLQSIAGLAAGTYYPLTFTIIVRNFSLRYLYMGIAIYALDILASTHLAHVVESFYIAHLSWQWIFWNALLTTPLLMLCIYFGIPRQKPPARNPNLDFSGFCYAACALTLIYIGLDQGERLDWLNSPLICAFLGSGIFFLAVTVVSRRLRPNPMVNLKFLCSRNFLLLGAILIGFRFLILEPTFLIPNYLQALHGYRPEQTAAVLTWVALPELLFAPLAGLLLYKVDSRLICAIGFALVGFSSFCCAGLDPNWTGETFLFNQVLTAAGLALGLAGIVASLLRSAMAAGALKAPMNLLTISCWFQTCRLFGAEVGKTGMAHFLKAQGDLHYNVLSAHINGDWLTAERLSTFAATASNASGSIDAASLAAASTIGANLKQQVALLAFADGFVLIALTAATCVMAIGCLTYCPPLISPRSK